MAGILAVMAAWTALVISVLSATRPWVVAGPMLDVGTLLVDIAVDVVAVVEVVAGPEDAIILCRIFVHAFPGLGASLPVVFCCHVAAMDWPHLPSVILLITMFNRHLNVGNGHHTCMLARVLKQFG